MIRIVHDNEAAELEFAMEMLVSAAVLGTVGAVAGWLSTLRRLARAG